MYQFIENYKVDGFGYGLVYKKTDNEFIGRVGLNRYELKKNESRIECGILLLPEYWKCGYATELVSSLLKYAKETINLDTLYATIDKNNYGSIKVAQKLGFIFSKEIMYFDILKNLYIKYL
jgi:ribosomal-protein-alanine N-acetyltransferase